MKKIISFSILFSITCLIYGQAALENPEMYIGATAGVAASMVQFSPTVEQEITNPILGAHAGVAWRYTAERCVGIQAELNFSQYGWKESETGYSRQLNYIEVPLLTHIYFGKKFRGFFNIGPKIGILLYDKSSQTTTATDAQYQKIDNRFDYGIGGGLGMLLNTKSGTYQLEARGNYSLCGIFGARKTDYFGTSNNIQASLNIGWFWKVK